MVRRPCRRSESRGEDTGNSGRSHVFVQPHNGNPREAFLEAVGKITIGNKTRVAVTGRKFRDFLNLSSISEPEAVETALAAVSGGAQINAVVSAGGETFLVYVIGGDGKISSIQTGNKCASGTGDFYVQQLRRMDISLEETAAFSPRRATLQGIRPMQRFLQKRLHACVEQGHSEGKDFLPVSAR